MIRSFPLTFYGVHNMKCRARVTDDVMCRAYRPGVSNEAGYRNPL
jgi:hypothetical protein